MSSRNLWFVVLFVVGILGVVSSASGWSGPVESAALDLLEPLQRQLSRWGRGASELLGSAGRLSELEAENARLAQENSRLLAELAGLAEQALENQRLRAALGYRVERPEEKLVLAEVIARDDSPLSRTVTIDRGSRDGLVEGLVVVSGDALVGKLTEVFEGASRVQLITHPASAVSVRVQRSRAEGVLRGHADGSLSLDYVPTAESVAVGDLIITSGLGGGYPPDLLVGKVSEVESSDFQMFHQVRVSPTARLRRLESVLVVTSFLPAQMP